MTKRLVTPCCKAIFKPFYRYEGRHYLQEKIVDGYMCEGENCYNEWDEQGFSTGEAGGFE